MVRKASTNAATNDKIIMFCINSNYSRPIKKCDYLNFVMAIKQNILIICDKAADSKGKNVCISDPYKSNKNLPIVQSDSRNIILPSKIITSSFVQIMRA